MSRKDQGARARQLMKEAAGTDDAAPAAPVASLVAATSPRLAEQHPRDGVAAPADDPRALARRYRALAEVAGQVLWTTTADGDLAGDLTSWCAFTGQSAEEARGQGWAAAVHPDDRAEAVAAWAAAVAERRRYVHEHRIRRQNGDYCDMLVRGAPVFSDDGQLMEWVGVCIDLTERKRLERRTAESLAALLEMAGVMVSPAPMADAPGDGPSGRIRHLIALCCQVLASERVAFVLLDPATEMVRDALLLGASREQEARWRAGLRTLRLEDRFDAAICARLRAGEAVLVEIGRLPANDPAPILSSRYFLLAPMLVAGGLAGYLGANFGDEPEDYPPASISLAQAVAQLVGVVIERERLLAEREEARGHALALLEINRRMDEFLSIVGHEMRTPLTVFKVHLQLFARALTPHAPATEASQMAGAVHDATAGSTTPPLATASDNHAQILGRMQHQVLRLERLIGDLLDAARLRNGTIELQLSDGDLVALVRETVEDQRVANPGRAITLALAPGVAEGWRVRMDRERIGQVLTNYLTNALKYTSSEAPIAVGVEARPGQIRVTVRDEGPGIAPERQARIWERFERLPEVQVQSGSAVGLGLGLYISREIVERHGGRVGIESMPGQGSTFWFSLPTARE